MAKKQQSNDLLTALRFVSIAQRDKGPLYQTHARFMQGAVIAFDGILAAGHLVQENMDVCPHSRMLIQALERCKTQHSFTIDGSGHLHIKAGRLKVVIPCADPIEVLPAFPDQCTYSATNILKEAFAALNPILIENAPRVVMNAIMLRSNTAVATNGHAMIEYFHGLNIVAPVLLPKVFVAAVLAADKNIIGYGCSDNSFTVHFEDYSWIRTQVFIDNYPDTDAIFNQFKGNVQPLPADFEEALDQLYVFVDDGILRFNAGSIQTHATAGKGASYDCAIDFTAALNAKQLKQCLQYMKMVDFSGDPRIVFFFGDRLRGALSKTIQA